MSSEQKDTNPKDLCGSNKVPFSTLSGHVLAEMGSAMYEGALKYGRFNWRVKKVLASVYFDATQRHLQSWWEGEDIDLESGYNHITKSMTSLHVLLDAILLDLLIDDRPPRATNKQSPFMNEYNLKIVELKKKYPNPVPPFTQIPIPL